MRLVTDEPSVYWTWVLQMTGVTMAVVSLIFVVTFLKAMWDDRKKK